MIHICSNKPWKLKIALGLGLFAACSLTALAANTITGVVRNQTRSRFAAGDEVILLRLDQGIQEEARTKTDSHGAFTLKLQYPDKPHLVRAIHQGVNYDRPASVGNAISIDVFDATAKVQDIAGSIEIIRTGTNGKLLHVSDMIEIKNDSSPPMTQAGERTFEIYLPAHAKIESVLAAGPEKIGMMISATPVRGEPEHYTVSFPLRPGATKFAFNYDLPYGGYATFRTKHMYPLQQLAVMIPPTMRFRSPSPTFQVLPAGNNNYHAEAALHVRAGEGPEFEVSGIGAFPSLQAQAHPPLQGANASGMVANSELSAQSTPLSWWASSTGIVLVLGTCGFLLKRRQCRSVSTITTAEQMPKQPGFNVEALKEELFQLEIDHLHGSISRDEYASAKKALDGTIQRALKHFP